MAPSISFLFLLLTFSKQQEFSNNGQNFGDIQIQFHSNDYFTIQFTEPYGIVLFPQFDNIVISYDISYQERNAILNEKKIFSNPTATHFFGVYLDKYIGTVKISSDSDKIQSFSWAIFPQNCHYKYFTNTNTTINFPNDKFTTNFSFCLLNAGVVPVNYEIKYDISLSSNPINLIFYTNSSYTTHPLSGKGTFSQPFKQTSLLELPNLFFQDSMNSHFLQIESTTSNLGQSYLTYDGLLCYEKPSLIIQETPSSSKKQVMIIIVTLVSFLILIVGSVILFKCLLKKKHNQLELETEVPRPPTSRKASDGIKQPDLSHSDSTDSLEIFKAHNFKDELLVDSAAYPQNDYNPSNVEYKVPKPHAIKNFLKHIKGEV